MKNRYFKRIFVLIFVISLSLFVLSCASGPGDEEEGAKEGTLSLTATPDTIVADGNSTSFLTATLKDSNGNPVVGMPVDFSREYDQLLEEESYQFSGDRNVYFQSYGGTTEFQIFYRGLTVVRLNNVEETESKLLLDADGGLILSDFTTKEALNPGYYFLEVHTTDNNWSLWITRDITEIEGDSLGTYITDSSGIANLTYKSTKAKGDVRLRASSGELKKDVTITQTAATPAQIDLSTTPASVYANGDESSTISAIVSDSNNNPVEDGTVVNFSATSGILSGITTTSGGVATAKLTSIPSTTSVTSMVTGTVGALTDSTNVEFEGIILSLAAAATTGKMADGTESYTITAQLIDESGQPISDKELTFTATENSGLAAINPPVTTTQADGTATFAVTDISSTDETVNISASFGGVNSNQISLAFTGTLITPQIASIELSANPSSLPANGSSQANINATVTIVGGGDAPDGTEVAFSIKEGDTGHGIITPTKTTAGGTASASLKSGNTPETVTITAEAGGRTAEIQMEYTPGNVALTIVPNSLLATGEETAVVTARVEDAAGNPAPDGETVFFTLDDLSLGTIDSSASTSEGQSQEKFHVSTKGGTVTVTATWKTSSVDVTGSETIDIQPPPAFIQIADGSPDPASINIKGTGGQSTSQIIFDVKDSLGNLVADGYRLDFTIDSGPNGGEDIIPPFGTTHDGQVSTILYSGFKSGPVSIKATYYHDTNITTTTSQIAINAGPPVGEEFGISAEYLNISGYWKANLEDQISIYAGDIYGNTIPDNTAISFKTYNTGGFFTPNTASTTGGVATNTLHSAGTYLQPLEGFVSATAEANGGRTTHVTSLAVTPGEHNIIYAGTDGGGVYKSSDSGASWTNISRSSTIKGQNWIDPYVNDISVDPDDHNTIYAATGYSGTGNIYRSLDGGLNWNSNNTEEWNGIYSTNQAVLTVLCDGGKSEYVWIGTEGLGALFATDGETFKESTGLGNGKVVFDMVKVPGMHEDDAVLYAASNTGVFRSGDGGRTWAETGQFTGDFINTLAIHPTVPTTIYAGTEDAGVWVSTNSGDTWTAYNDGMGKGLSATVPVPARDNTGNGVINELAVNQNAKSEYWLVECIPEDPEDPEGETTFSVSGTVSDKQANNATVGERYTSNNDEISFTILDGSTGFEIGDTFTFSTTRDHGRTIKDLLVDKNNNKLYAITYFWGPLEQHAVGNVYVHGLQQSNGAMDDNPWVEANTDKLPQYDPPDDTTLFAQHVMALDDTEPALYIGGEGINLYKAKIGIDIGAPQWYQSKSGLTNLIMARMPILFSGECHMYINEGEQEDGTIIYTIYIQDVNGNPPVAGSTFKVEYKRGEDTTVYFDKKYSDVYADEGTWRDPADISTNIPYITPAITPIPGDEVTFTFSSPECTGDAPGCSGSEQKYSRKF